MASPTESKKFVKVFIHITNVLHQRFNELQKNIANSTDVQENHKSTTLIIGSMMKEVNEHLNYLKFFPFITTEDKDKATVIFTEFKLDILEYQNGYTFQTQSAKFEEMSQKYRDETRTTKELRTKMKFLEKRGLENKDNEKKIPITGSLVVKAYLTGCCEEIRCIPFDEGYTSYTQLREKIQDVFCLKSNNFELKCPDSEVDFKQISTSDEYEKIVGQSFDMPVTVIEVYIHMETDKDDSETEGTSIEDNSLEEDSGADSESFSEISVQGSPLIRINSNAKWDKLEYKQNEHPRMCTASKIL
ncbi:hypothetical protein DFQ28_001402 [Apophysomyces sp. BC1034]|nr:hypothetical protein DFQ30_001761 [Apophysomyces sp. BC1015]KAG0178024.1 hypothetical protein DFQ29_004023 [Apophysomyces sp. BC1021]KAG0190886.1 hypothetical protein DFQ28_001402 [Apophysomyces sp. BC1034]